MTRKTTRSASSTGSRKTPGATSGKSSTPKSRNGDARSEKPKVKAVAKPTATPKKTVRRASKLGRSRIPANAPLELIFEHDQEAQAAFSYLGINTIRELQKFDPDELIMRLTSPTKLTVGRIRKMLAMNNRCLEGDERFALDVQKQK